MSATKLVSVPFLVGFLRGAHQWPVAGRTAKVPDAAKFLTKEVQLALSLKTSPGLHI